MKIYNFNKITDNKILFIGDIHGEYDNLISNFKMRTDFYKDSLVILLGDCGLGFNKMNYYNDIFINFNNKFLKENNINILMIRGNHDDPSFFENELINFSNIKSIPDYSLIICEKNNILCVGGGLSVDRIWRKQYDNKINRFQPNKEKWKKSYWENELPVFNEEKVNEILEKYEITTVASHTSPSFFPFEDDFGINSWLKLDNSLKDDLVKERGEMDKLYFFLKEKAHLKYWLYGHFHDNKNGKYENVIYYMLNKNTFNTLSTISLEKVKSNKPISIDDEDICQEKKYAEF